MMNGENDMEEMLTWEQYMALPRYTNGRIKDLPLYWYRMNQDMLDTLTGDDWSYYMELQEELAYELSFYR
jgi:hypothetical protein